MYSVNFSPDLVQFQVRETVSGVLLARIDIQMQVWHMVEVMRRDLNEPLMTHREPTWKNANDRRSVIACGNELPRDS